jgi:hypothetical protein
MKDSRKEFIKQAHKSACSEWKEKIEQEFPKLFKSIKKANGWYKDEENEWCMFFENGIIKYGLDVNSDWRDNLCTKYTLRVDDYKATYKEVEEALIKEAKKRGFKEGVSFLSISDGVKKQGSYFGYYSTNNQICLGGGTIFKDGQWATIVETITKKQAEKELGKTILN